MSNHIIWLEIKLVIEKIFKKVIKKWQLILEHPVVYLSSSSNKKQVTHPLLVSPLYWQIQKSLCYWDYNDEVITDDDDDDDSESRNDEGGWQLFSGL